MAQAGMARFREHVGWIDGLVQESLAWRLRPWKVFFFFFFFFTLVTGPSRSVSLSDTRVYEPQTRARLGTTAHFCRVEGLALSHSFSGACWVDRRPRAGVAGLAPPPVEGLARVVLSVNLLSAISAGT